MDLNTIFDGWGTELLGLIAAILIGGSVIWRIYISRKKEVNKYNNTGDHSKQNITKNDHSGNVNIINSTITINDNHAINASSNKSTPQDKLVPLKDYLKDKLSESRNKKGIGVEKQQVIYNDFEKNIGEYFDINLINRLDENEKQILCLLYSNYQMNNRELCRKLSLSSKTIADKLAKLRDLGIISWIGNKSHGYWQVNVKS